MKVIDVLKDIRKQVVGFTGDEGAIVRLEATQEYHEDELQLVVIVDDCPMAWLVSEVDFFDLDWRDSLLDVVVEHVKLEFRIDR